MVKGLNRIKHKLPSVIGINTIYQSKGKIPLDFLHNCGVSAEFIPFISSLITAEQVTQFHSCFISYSTEDEEFARRLHSRFQEEHLRVWFAPEDIKGGEKLHEQIERAIQSHDRLLLVLSNSSMQSEWVITEVRNARKIEFEQRRRKLFPISLVNFKAIREWRCLDSDTGKDLAAEVREYFIPDFSEWENPESFEASFQRLLRDLKLSEIDETDRYSQLVGSK